MEEKKQMNVSMSGFFLAIAIIVIAVMGYFIYKISTEKEEKEKQIASLNKEISGLQSSSRELQGKIDNIANTINTTKETKSTTINNEKALNLGKEEYQLANSIQVKTDNTVILDKNKEDNNNPWYKVTNMDDIKSIFTGNAFDYFCKEYQIKEFNGMWGMYASNRGTTNEYIESNIEKVDNINENEIKFTVKAKYANNLSDINGQDKSKITNYSTKEYKFTITKENDNWKVSEYTIPW